MNDDILIRVARLLRQLASCAFTHDAAGRPTCPVCAFQSEANLVRRESVGYPVFVYEIRSHHKPDCELAALADAVEEMAEPVLDCKLEFPQVTSGETESGQIDLSKPVVHTNLVGGTGAGSAVYRTEWVVDANGWEKHIAIDPVDGVRKFTASGALRIEVPCEIYLRYRGDRIERTVRRCEPYAGTYLIAIPTPAPDDAKLEDYEVVVEMAP